MTPSGFANHCIFIKHVPSISSIHPGFIRRMIFRCSYWNFTIATYYVLHTAHSYLDNATKNVRHSTHHYTLSTHLPTTTPPIYIPIASASSLSASKPWLALSPRTRINDYSTSPWRITALLLQWMLCLLPLYANRRRQLQESVLGCLLSISRYYWCNTY